MNGRDYSLFHCSNLGTHVLTLQSVNTLWVKFTPGFLNSEERKIAFSLYVINCTCISAIQHQVLLLCNHTKCWFSLCSSSTAALHPLSKEKHMIFSLSCIFVCVWRTMHNIPSFTWPTEYHPSFSRPFLWFVEIVYPPQQYASSAPATSLLSLEHVLLVLQTAKQHLE